MREVPTEGGLTMRPIDGDALFAVVRGHHDLYKGATNPADKARRDECLQVMCDINDAPTIAAIPVEWLKAQIAPYMGDISDLGKGAHNATIKNLIRKWQQEQEAK